MAAKIYKNLIGGEWVESRSGKSFENQNPANSKDVVGVFPRSTKDDVNVGGSRPLRATERSSSAAHRCSRNEKRTARAI
jgi:acyl-CoA reductase-like NAD-dependent aldehyde dehydrogenase